MFTVGDTRPALTGTINANLTGATVSLVIRKPDGTTLTKTPTLSDLGGGVWQYSYTWAPGELSVSGRWFVRARVTFSGADGPQTFGPTPFWVQD